MLIRKIVPNYDLDEELNQEFALLLKSLRKKLQPIFSKYLKQEEFETTEPITRLKDEILGALSSGNVALISANSSKKILKSLGVDPRLLIVTGGPVSLEDYKKVNPNLSNEAIEGINKKCERLLREIKEQNWTNKELIFIYESGNPTDKLILNKLQEISNIIGKNVKTIGLKSWKKLENQ